MYASPAAPGPGVAAATPPHTRIGLLTWRPRWLQLELLVTRGRQNSRLLVSLPGPGRSRWRRGPGKGKADHLLAAVAATSCNKEREKAVE